MEIEARVAVITGGGGGIGGALARAIVDHGGKVLIADLDGDAAAAVAAAIEAEGAGRAIAMHADVTNEAQLAEALDHAERQFGPVDLFFANAGVIGPDGIAADDDWAATIDINLLAHVRAARLLVPRWLERGLGYFITTASAAGLLTQVGHAPYAVTKHAAVAFAEWLSVTYGSRGIRVSCVCPMGVDTGMLNSDVDAQGDASVGRRVVTSAGPVLSPEDVAEQVIATIQAERFLALPHPEVLEFYRRKGSDYDRWLAGMRRLQRRADEG